MEIRDLADFLKPILDAKIVEFSSHNLIPAGENYGGVIIALDVKILRDNKEETKHFIAKLIPPNEMLGVMFNIQNTFKREVQIYTDIIPTMIKLQEEHSIQQDYILQCFPKCLGARLNLNNSSIVDENGLILLENLKTQGYEMENRMLGFDLELSKLILKKLAQFHALPIALKLLKPAMFEAKISTLKPYSFGDSFTEEMKQHFCEELHNILNEIGCEKYSAKVVDLVDKGFKFEERFLEPKGQYLTVAHHDLWTNNLMVLRHNTHPVKIKFLDLQMASFGSLAHDLIFFLFSSVRQDVFNNNYSNLIKIYFDSFINCLKLFSLDTSSFTWESFVDELDEIGTKQISHIVIMLRPIFMEKNQVQDMSEMNENEMSALRELNPQYETKLKDVVHAFADRKWL